MNAEVRTVKTAAELSLADAYVAARRTLPGVASLREEAFRAFERDGLPNRRVEEWKYTDLRALMRDAKPVAGAPDAAAKAKAIEAGKIISVDARRIVFVDGAFVPELSDLSGLSKGLTIRPMAEALVANDPLVAKHLGKMSPADSAVALNTALMRDGALIHVAAGATLDRPVHLIFFAGSDKPVSIFTRSLVVVEKDARAMIVESHEGGTDHQINTALDLVIGDNAHVDHVKIVANGDGVVHVSSMMTAIGARANFNDFTFNIGGAAVRNQFFVNFDGPDTVAGIRGASLLKGKQHADNTLVADHRKGGCQCREVFKSVLDDESRGVFQGKIIVRQHAQKTDAKMMTRALLLSEDAEADNKPELEIFADDVQCGHGATSGALDENLRFYLMARGIPEKEAEALLVQAFVGEAVEGIEHAGLRDALMEHVVAWLRARAG